MATSEPVIIEVHAECLDVHHDFADLDLASTFPSLMIARHIETDPVGVSGNEDVSETTRTGPSDQAVLLVHPRESLFDLRDMAIVHDRTQDDGRDRRRAE
jgi:hypothetical protein